MTKTVEEIRLESERMAGAMKRWLESPDGKEVFKALYKEFADRNSHVPGDPYTTAFNEGQRSVILFLTDIRESDYE